MHSLIISDSDIHLVSQEDHADQNIKMELRTKAMALKKKVSQPPNLLMISLLEQLCIMYTQDLKKAKQLFESK